MGWVMLTWLTVLTGLTVWDSWRMARVLVLWERRVKRLEEIAAEYDGLRGDGMKPALSTAQGREFLARTGRMPETSGVPQLQASWGERCAESVKQRGVGAKY